METHGDPEERQQQRERLWHWEGLGQAEPRWEWGSTVIQPRD